MNRSTGKPVKQSSLAHLECSIAQTLEIVGEWWTLLVLRNISFGQRRFEAIQADLGIARNVLSDRLATLVDHGILVRTKYAGQPGAVRVPTDRQG